MLRVFSHFMDGNNRKCLSYVKSVKARKFENA